MQTKFKISTDSDSPSKYGVLIYFHQNSLINDKDARKINFLTHCANFFSIPSMYANEGILLNIIETIRSNSFDGGRHMTRLTKARAD